MRLYALSLSLNPSPSSRSFADTRVYVGWQFTPSITNKVIDVRSEAGIFTPEITAEARDRANKDDDGAGRFGRVMWRVLLDDAEV